MYSFTYREIFKKAIFANLSNPNNTMKSTLFCFILSTLSIVSLHAQQTNYIKVEKTTYSNIGQSYFKMGTATNPQGKTITLNSQSMLFDNKPVLPVMGEIHFARVPKNEWRKEILKMKAGGINIIATYIFWIHHEEIEGEFDWSGQRNLGEFVRLCKELDMPVVIRTGPWCHGEARNGGFPEWLVNSGIKLRDNNPQYMEKVQIWYSQIFEQVKGQLWKDGGTIIGMQIENEYRGRWEHLEALKKMAIEIGFDVPLYTRTGWPKLSTAPVFGEIIPLYGDYADGFWDRSLTEMPGDYGKSFIFRSFRNSTVIATEQLPKQSDKDNPDDIGYPYFTCELGGGMMTSYHRRVNINPMDVYSMALVRVGSGSNLPGYYMYHGGTNPEGKLTTLNEEQASNFTYHNDLPVKTYDFQAPLGEFGQINPHYHLLRRFHLFLQDFGSDLAQMPPYFPENAPTDFNDDSMLRWSVRSNGESGYIFVNNYHRLKTLSDKNNIQFTLDLPNEKLIFPKTPINIPANASFFIPFNMNIGASRLIYSTAQPICQLNDENGITVFFTQNANIPADFVFDAKNIQVKSAKVKNQKTDNKIYFNNINPSKDVAIQLQDKNGRKINIIVLDEATSLSLWKGEFAGKDRIFITNAELTYENNKLCLTEKTPTNLSPFISFYPSLFVSIYPSPEKLNYNGKVLYASKSGLFGYYKIEHPLIELPQISLQKVKEAGPLRTINMGKAKVAEMPHDPDFDQAAVWNISFTTDVDATRDIYLKIPYIGDVARVYLEDKLLTDNFYNGKVFEVGLKNMNPDVYKKGITVKILPLEKDAPIYLPQQAKPDFGDKASFISLPSVDVYEKYSVELIAE